MITDNYCGWAKRTKEEILYHNTRWCKPTHDENELFAMLCLEGFQAGISWSIILKKENAFRKAFDNFDPQIVKNYSEDKINILLNNKEIIRNRLKINATINNAKMFLKIQNEFESFDNYIWHFTNGKVIINHPKTLEETLTKSELSEKISNDLQKRGFKFVGAVIIYSYLQSIGIINDHLEGCPFKY